MPSFKLPQIDRKDTPEEQVDHLSDSVERMRKEIEYALENLDSMNVAHLTTEHTIIKSEYGETEIKGPILSMKDHEKNERLTLGLNKQNGLFSFDLKNQEGDSTITLNSEGNAIFRGIIGVLADDGSRTVIDGPLITMNDGSQDRIILGYNELYEQFEFILKNKLGQETVYLDTDGNAVFRGVINVLQDAGGRTIIDGPTIAMTDGVNLRLNMGYNESENKFEFGLRNKQGAYTILINEDGNAIFEGFVVASSFVGGSIDIGNGTFKVDEAGNLEATSAFIQGQIEGSSFVGGSINIGNGQFTVDSNGKLVAQNAVITGEIHATSGTFTGELSGATITGGTISGTSITGGTITGALIRTSTSGTRIQLSGNTLEGLTDGVKRVGLENNTGLGGATFYNMNFYNENGQKNGQIGAYGNNTEIYNRETGVLRLGHNVAFEPTGTVNFAQTHVAMHEATSISGVVKDRNNDGIELTYSSTGIGVRDKNGNEHFISYS